MQLNFKFIFSVFKTAFLEIINNRKYFVVWIVLSVLFLFFYLYVPVIATPANDLMFQIAITPIELMLLMIFLSLLTGLLVAMQLFIFFRLKQPSLNSTVTGFPGLVSGLVSGIFASASCAACINAFLAFLGATTIGVLLETRFEIIALSLFIVLVGLYFSSKRITNKCETCKINF